MAAGDVSKLLAGEIRGRMNDMGKARVHTDAPFYQLLTKYQREWMTMYKTTVQTFKLVMVTNQLLYPLDAKLFEIISIFVDPDTGNFDLTGWYDEDNHQIVMTSDFTAGDFLYVKGYIKPVTDKISTSTDPLLQVDYNDYLIDAVLSNYSTKEQVFEPLSTVEARVKRMANNMRSKFRAQANQGFRGLQW